MQRILGYAGMALALGACLVSCQGPRGEPSRTAAPAARARGPALAPPSGPPAAESGADALVQVQVYYPPDPGHAPLRELVDKVNKRYAGKAHAVFVAFGSPEAAELTGAAKPSSGCVLVNGEADWEIEEPTGKRSVGFRQRMGDKWQEEDLYRVLDKLTGMGTARKP